MNHEWNILFLSRIIPANVREDPIPPIQTSAFHPDVTAAAHSCRKEEKDLPTFCINYFLGFQAGWNKIVLRCLNPLTHLRGGIETGS